MKIGKRGFQGAVLPREQRGSGAEDVAPVPGLRFWAVHNERSFNLYKPSSYIVFCNTSYVKILFTLSSLVEYWLMLIYVLSAISIQYLICAMPV
jgi:hypothetical protein